MTIAAKKDEFNFKEASKYMNDLSYIIIPFDKTNKHF